MNSETVHDLANIFSGLDGIGLILIIVFCAIGFIRSFFRMSIAMAQTGHDPMDELR